MATSVADLAALGAAPADGDRILGIDVSDTSDSADGTLKTVTVAFLRDAVIQEQSAIADVPTAGSATAAANATAINSILAALRTVGVIAT